MKPNILYPGDLTDLEWQYLEPLLPARIPTKRPRKYDLRSIINGIFYLVRSGSAWRMPGRASIRTGPRFKPMGVS